MNPDRKDAPLQMTADFIRKYDAGAFILVIVHSAGQAEFNINDNLQRMMTAFIGTEAPYEEYLKAGSDSRFPLLNRKEPCIL